MTKKCILHGGWGRSASVSIEEQIRSYKNIGMNDLNLGMDSIVYIGYTKISLEGKVEDVISSRK